MSRTKPCLKGVANEPHHMTLVVSVSDSR